MMKNKLLLAALATTSVWVSGCVVYPVEDSYYGYQQEVVLAPPPPRYENPGYAPSVGFLWIDGYWNWGGGRYVWVPGRWEAPRPGYYWAPHRWERDGNRWRRHGGTWERGEREMRRPPEPAVVHRPAYQDNHVPGPSRIIAPLPGRIQQPESHIVPRQFDRRGAADNDDRRHREPAQVQREIRPAPARGDARRAESADKRRQDIWDDLRSRSNDKDTER